MKILTTIEENKTVNVKRYEGDLIVGERNVSVIDYCYSLISQLPIGSHFQYMVENIEEYKEYFKELEDMNGFTDFLSHIITSAPKGWVSEDQTVLSMVSEILRKLPYVSIDTPEVSVFLKRLIESMDSLNMDSEMYVVLLGLLRKAIQGNCKDLTTDLSNAVFHTAMSVLKSDEKKEMMNVIENIIPYLDGQWFSEMVLASQKRAKSPLIYYTGQIPKDVSYMGVSTRGTTFVYDVPAQQVDINFKGQKIEKVGHPRLLFLYQLNDKNIVSSMRLYAAKTNEALNNELMLHHYPFSHVFGNGNVCWNFSDITVEMMPYAAEMFLSAVNSTHGRADVFDIYMENKEVVFDDSKLSPMTKLGDVL